MAKWAEAVPALVIWIEKFPMLQLADEVALSW
jgi:hypothetical protein